MSDLLTFYRIQRTRTMIVLGKGSMPMKAAPALAKAREMLAIHKAAKAHYETVAAIVPRDETAYRAALKAVAASRGYLPDSPCLTYQPGKPGLAHVSDPAAFGLRHVGRVTPESYGGRDTWDKRESCGWHTDPHGDTITGARDTMRKALDGDGPSLCVYMGETEQGAFCEAAGLQAFPA